ncbi:Uu.00g040180.m01.CDS01 [Anthostomella pinea]|uniref:Uu.00g040180.m01.CDS01 n=1 Tax=Anthostomella pinea TaxID=933095 RepID=A0AAI8YDW6_9PEZI|nr:Uu.00g040180.m01.CDS01 [Anthostomella pinea]
MHTPTTTKAVVIVAPGKAAVQEVPLPKLHDGYILVKVRAVGLNPTDWKSIHAPTAPAGARSGCDYAGDVVEVGAGVDGRFGKGDRVAGMVFGGNPKQLDSGAFGEYIVAKQHLQIKIPDNISYEEAATLGVSITTVSSPEPRAPPQGQGLYKKLGLPLPPAQDGRTILIYGGSTATGIYGIQFAKASGLRVVTTASPRNFDFLKALGADAVFDYNSPTCVRDIREYTGNELRLVWDCVGAGEICATALSNSPSGPAPKYAHITKVKREEIEPINARIDGPHFTVGYDALGEPYNRMGVEHTPQADEADHAAMFWELVRKLLEAGDAVRPLRPTVNRGGSGLEGVLGGLEELRAGRVSGGKLVYTL